MGSVRSRAALPLALQTLASLALALGCAPTPTQLIVVVDTDLAVPAQLDDVTIAVTATGGVTKSEHQPLSSPSILPLTLAVRPSGESLGPIDVVATGHHGGTDVVSRHARVTLVRGETRMLRLDLYASCVGTTCSAAQSCGARGCEPIAVTTLPPWTGMPSRVVDAGPVDSGGVRDAGMGVDAATACTGDAQCDDGIACTTDACTSGFCLHSPSDTACADHDPCSIDRCVPGTGCVHDPSDAACDDGNFCNGFDQCAGGTCSVHTGDPCVAPTVCDMMTSTCRGCVTDSNCPADSVGAWGACSWSGTCAETAMRERTVRHYACASGACVPMDSMEQGTCTRTTAGMSCGAGSCGSFGGCDYSDGCDQSASQSRTCTDLVCSGGTCTSSPRSESMPCSRSTDGMSCGGTSCTGWGACDYTDACDQDATQTRTCNDPVCSGGSCGGGPSHTESQGCSRSTENQSCGPGRTCRGGSCTSCAPSLGGSAGVTGSSYFNNISAGGSSINFVDGSGTASGTVSAAGVTFGGGSTFPICAWQVIGMGNVLRFIDWDGSTAVDVSVSGATVSGSIAPPCQPGPYGCFPPCIGHVAASGSALHVDYATGESGDISFGCP